MLKMIADMKAQLAMMEAAISGAQSVPVAAAAPAAAAPAAAAPAVEKPKRPLSEGLKMWHERCKRLDATLKHFELPFKRVAEAKQFASSIYAKEKEAGIEMREDKIIEARRAWAEEHKPVCAVCKLDATEDPSTHGACAATYVQTFIDAGKGDKEQGMADWLKASGLKMPKSDSEDEAPKKAGRPKMTEEQKAAAKAAKAAMTPEEKVAAKAAREAKKAVAPPAAKTPGAPKKVAWAENPAAGGGGGPTFEEQLDEAINAM
jgi:hypothetical protein